MNHAAIPWPLPANVYADSGPPSGCAEFESEGVRWRVTATSKRGCDTGRVRYEVRCLTCGCVVHEATTGPQGWMEAHLHREHGWQP